MNLNPNKLIENLCYTFIIGVRNSNSTKYYANIFCSKVLGSNTLHVRVTATNDMFKYYSFIDTFIRCVIYLFSK